MKAIKYKIILILLCNINVFSQNFLGLSSSNYGGSNTLQLNPANVADSRNKVFVNFGGIGFDIHNNALRWTAPFSILKLATDNVESQYKTPNGEKVLWRNEYSKLLTNKNYSNSYINSELKGPSILINLDKGKIGIAAGQRFRLLNSLTNSSLSVGQTIVEGTKSSNLSGILKQENSLIFNLGAYQEYYGTLGIEVFDDGINYIKIGGTAKYLVSDLNVNIFSNSFDFQISPDPNKPTKQIITLSSVQGSISIANASPPNTTPNPLPWLYAVNGVGKGLAADIGISYEYRPDYLDYNLYHKGTRISDPRYNKYKYKIGFSLIDFGAVFYNDPSNVKNGNISETIATINPGTFNKIKSSEELLTGFETIFPSLNSNTYSNKYYVLMPATAIATFDYKFDNTNYYINTIWRQSLLSKTRRGAIGYSGITVIPRIEKKNIEFSLPIGLDNNYSNINVGLMFRFTGFYIGSDNITGILNIGNPRGASIYSGLFLPIEHRLEKNKMLIWRKYNYKKNRNYKK